MKKSLFVLMVVLSVAVGFAYGVGPATAADVPPSYTASPDVYKVISENEHFRVIMTVWKPGQRDAMHSHAGPLVGYRLTDCNLKVYTPDGKTSSRVAKAGEALFNPIIAAHSVENIGSSECKLVIVEKK